MAKQPLWHERQKSVKESESPKDPNWEEKFKQEIKILNQKIQQALKAFKK